MSFIQENKIIIFSVLALLTFSLSIYLGMMFVRIRNFKNAKLLKEQINQKRQLKKAAERETFLKDSIIIICRASVQKQCELSEACIRIKKLLENYPSIAIKPEFSPIQEMYAEIEKFPYLDSRQELTKKERFMQDNERFKIEEAYASKMDNSLKLLLEHFVNLP
jgi:hypothetical protein